MMLLAVTDHFFYLDGGHTLDFHNKAFESLQLVGSELKVRVLASLVPLLSDPTRSEELHQWQAPTNLVAPLKEAFGRLERYGHETWRPLDSEEEEKVLQTLLDDKPLVMISLLSEVLASGGDPVRLAQLVALAAAERIVRFHTQNDFGDWIAVLHTFTHAHAVHESLKRSTPPLLFRSIFLQRRQRLSGPVP